MGDADPYLNEAQREIRESVRRFAAAELAPSAGPADRDDRFPAELVPRLAEQGLLTLPLEERWGGIGADAQTLSVVLEEVGYAFAAFGPVLLSTYSPLRIVDLVGQPAQKEAFFAAATSRPSLGAFCLSEPHMGSDAKSMRTRARRTDRGWVLDGTKRWITNATVADHYLLFARTGDDPNHVSCFVLAANTPGLSFGRKEDKMGLRGGPMADVVLDGAEAPETALIGEPGEGWSILARTANAMRCWGAASIALGIARAALDAAVAWAGERRAFGQPIGRFQGVGFKLADMAMSIRAAELLVRDTNRRVDLEGAAATTATMTQVSMAKCMAADVAMRAAMEAVQIHGANGYMRGSLVERLFRDAKAFQILDGSNEVQRLIVARDLLRGDTG